MGALLKSPIGLALAAALVVWWFWRRKAAADCHCDQPATTGDPPIATAVYSPATPPATPAGDYVTPPAHPGGTPNDGTWSEQCVRSGGSPSWDPIRNAAYCARADWTGDVYTPTPDRPGVVQPTPTAVLDCHGIGGVTLPDGSCCVPPACTPPVIFTGYGSDPYAGSRNGSSGPPVIFGGYASDPYASSRVAPGAPAGAEGTPRLKCEGSGGRFHVAGGNGDYCACPEGTYLGGGGYCTSSIG